jgi:type II secretory pathway component PulC
MLCFAGNSRSNTQQAAYSAAAGGKSPADMQNRFGKRVGDKRWVLMRSELMNYYKEVLNNTDRLAKVYDSLKPVYQGNNIAGYTLIVEGEGEMFGALGLQPGDVIRQVNSMPMTSQTKAEYFIGEFVKNRVNGFVLDIERSGRKEKLIYMIR